MSPNRLGAPFASLRRRSTCRPASATPAAAAAMLAPPLATASARPMARGGAGNHWLAYPANLGPLHQLATTEAAAVALFGWTTPTGCTFRICEITARRVAELFPQCVHNGGNLALARPSPWSSYSQRRQLRPHPLRQPQRRLHQFEGRRIRLGRGWLLAAVPQL